MTEDRRGRGRPRGRSERGRQTRERLYRAALRLFAERGYEATTLRDIGDEAGVSAALVYRYFEGKSDVVMALYDELSGTYATRAAAAPAGPWAGRFLFALEASLEVLGPHRDTLSALTALLVADPERGVLASPMSPARARVEQAFIDAVVGASDAPPAPLGPALGRLLYLAHLALILWWLLDRSPAQRATHELLKTVRAGAPMLALALKLPEAEALVVRLEALVSDAFGA